MNNPLKNGRLHRIHLYTDMGIGSIALATIVLGEEIIGDLFWQADFVFHITVFVLAFGGIIAERVLHGKRHRDDHNHSGVIGT